MNILEKNLLKILFQKLFKLIFFMYLIPLNYKVKLK